MQSLTGWFVRNPVAANLLMFLILALGAQAFLFSVPLEVYPRVRPDVIDVDIVLPGGAPREVEASISIRVEEALQDLEGIEQLRSVSREAHSRVSVEVSPGYDPRELLDDIKSRVEAIDSLPSQAERPRVHVNQRRLAVLSLILYGDKAEMELRRLAEQVRDDLTRLPEVTQVVLDSPRAREVAIEVPARVLKEYGLSLARVAAAVERASLNLSAGNIRTQGADILVQTRGQAYSVEQFGRIAVLSDIDGSRVKLGDIARISNGFEENRVRMRFNGVPAMAIDVYRVGDQSAIRIADQVKSYIHEQQSQMPEGVSLEYWRDRSQIIRTRLQGLSYNALQGGALVLILLALFLRPKVAFWVSAGIPVTFMGCFLVMSLLDVTLNVASLFAFVLVLGLVVDDAVVTGENIHTHFGRHGDGLRAAVEGTREVTVPVTFGILTTLAAFVPLLLVEGRRGPLVEQIPLVVIPVLIFSLVESKLILPAHLRSLTPPDQHNAFFRLQQGAASVLENIADHLYRPLLRLVMSQRYLALASLLGFSLIVLALVLSGWTRFLFTPRVQSELATATLTMPAGTPFAATDQQVRRLTEAARQLRDRYRDNQGQPLITHILSTSGSDGRRIQPNLGRVMFEMVPLEERTLPISSARLIREWRQLVGLVRGIEAVHYRAEIGRTTDPLRIQLRGDDPQQLRALALELRQRLHSYPELFDITELVSDSKQELQLKIRPTAQMLGVTLEALAYQVRHGFHGYEVQRIQQGRNEIRVMVRYPASERASLDALNRMTIATPAGKQIPLHEAAMLSSVQSPSSIFRVNRHRILEVSADANKETADLNRIRSDVDHFLQQQLSRYPEISYSFEGEAKEQRESFRGLYWGLGVVVFVVYGLLAIPLGSYLQPLIVMSVIPYAMVGAVIGHWIMDIDLTMMSLLGMLPLAGVVVNDSLILVDYINRRTGRGEPLIRAVRRAGRARFRPVVLTSLTTFAGYLPLIFVDNTQGQFIIHMAVSIGFGVLFATLITLLMVPAHYLILEDLKAIFADDIRQADSRE